MGGISEVDGEGEVDILAVWGWGYKNSCNLGTIGLINTKYRDIVAGGMPYHQVALFWTNNVMGCTQVHQKWHWSSKGAFLPFSCP